MTESSSNFTTPGPPLIGALLRVPWEAVHRHMLERLHGRGFDDLDAAHLIVFQYPGPQGTRPSELAEIEGDWARQLGTARFEQLRALLRELNAAAGAPPP